MSRRTSATAARSTSPATRLHCSSDVLPLPVKGFAQHRPLRDSCICGLRVARSCCRAAPRGYRPAMRCLTTIACLALLLLVCCGPGGQTDAAAPTFAKAGGVAGNADAAGAEPKAEQQPDAARKVVCTGEMLLRVGELDGARTSVLAATRAAGGYATEDRL